MEKNVNKIFIGPLTRDLVNFRNTLYMYIAHKYKSIILCLCIGIKGGRGVSYLFFFLKNI